MSDNRENRRVGKRIARVRRLRKIRQSDLAEKMGFSVTHFCNLERGKVNITVFHLSTLSKILNVPVEQLVSEILDKTKL